MNKEIKEVLDKIDYVNEIKYYKKQYYNFKSRIDKALIYLGKCDFNDKFCFEKLINILNGSDNE